MTAREVAFVPETSLETSRCAEIDRAISTLIRGAGLTASRNRFFKAARAVKAVDGHAALRIAHDWREVTKTFMFTTIAGLGKMAREAALSPAPPRNQLGVIQTVFRVIGDDLNNVMPIFRASAPAGVGGIHYLWWEDSVLRPIADRLGPGCSAPAPQLPASVRTLEANMHVLSHSALGTAVQLRVVEAIALDIVIAFKRIFSRVVIDGTRVFATNDMLSWMNAHIRAEVAHNHEVSDHDTGMASLADTGPKQAEMLRLAAEYCGNWNAALEDFAAALG